MTKIKLISASEFKRVPWKNGKGETIELAISEGGELGGFDWRLSIARVSENGAFSNFPHITRNLVLIEGAHLALHHDTTFVTNEDGKPLEPLAQPKTDVLNELLSFATFDGGTTTKGEVTAGAIIDFNMMHNANKYHGQLETYLAPTEVNLAESELTFVFQVPSDDVFSLGQQATNSYFQLNSDTESTLMPSGDLLQLTDVKQGAFSVVGERLIVITLNKR